MRLDRPLGPLGLVPSAATPAIILIYISTLSKLNPHVSTRNCADVKKGNKSRGGAHGTDTNAFFYQNEQPRCVTKHLSVLHN